MGSTELLEDEILDYEFDGPNSECYSDLDDSDSDEDDFQYHSVEDIKLLRTPATRRDQFNNDKVWTSRAKTTLHLALWRIRALDDIFMRQLSLNSERGPGPPHVKRPRIEPQDIVIVTENDGNSKSCTLDDTCDMMNNVCPNFMNVLACPTRNCRYLHALPDNLQEQLERMPLDEIDRFYESIRKTKLFAMAFPHLIRHVGHKDMLYRFIPDLLRADASKFVGVVVLELLKSDCSPLEIVDCLVENYYSDRMLECILDVFTLYPDNLCYFWDGIVQIFRCKGEPFPAHLINDLIDKVKSSNLPQCFLDDIQREVIDKCLVLISH